MTSLPPELLAGTDRDAKWGPQAGENAYRWATVTGLTPLQIRMDGDIDPLPLIPETLASPGAMIIGTRVWVQLFKRRVIIVGMNGGDGGASGGGEPSGPAGGDLTGAYPDPQIAPDAVGSAEIAPDAVGPTEIAPNAVGNSEIASEAVTGAKIGPLAVANGHLQDNSVDARVLAPGSVGSSEIVDGSVQAGDLAPGVIPSIPASLPPSGPAGGDLLGSTYPNPTIAPSVVTSAKIADNTIVEGDLAATLKDGTATSKQVRTVGSTAADVARGDHTHGGYSPTGHTHPASDVVSGVLDVARVGTGPGNAEYLKAGGVSGAADWVTPAVVKTDLALTKADVGLSNVPNVDTTNASNITTGTLPTSVLPPLAINEVFTVASQAAMLALPAQRGDMAIRTDTGKTYVLASDSPGTLADWKEVMATGQVVSVAGKTGVVTLTKADVGLGSVDNTSDAAKPVSTAQQAALDLKANLTDPRFTDQRVPTDNSVTSAKIMDGTVTMADLAAALQSAIAASNVNVYGFGSQVVAGASRIDFYDACFNVSANPTASDARIGIKNVSTLGPGLAPTSPGGSTAFLRADGTWSAPPSSPTSLPPNGPAGGDLTGTYPNPDIGAGKVGATELATDAVTSVKIVDLNVITAKIGTGQVTMRTIADLNVTTAKIADTDVTNAKLAPNAVTSDKIADGTIQAGDMAPGVIPTIPSTLPGPPTGPAGGDLTGTYPDPTLSSATVQGLKPNVQDEGVNKALDIAVLNFKGAGVVAAQDSLGTAGITIDGVDVNAVHKTGDESIAGVKTFTDPLAFEEESTSPSAPVSGSRFFTRAGKMWVKTPSVEYALGVESAAVSLLINGDFETRKGAVGTEPTGWNGFWHAGASTAIQATDDSATGLASAKCHINAVADENINLQTDAAFPVTGGGVLNLEFNAKRGPQAGVKLDIVLQSSVDATNGSPNFFAAGTFTTGTTQVFPVNGWTHYIRQFPVPAGHTLGRIAIRAMKDTSVADAQTTAQDVWIDSCVAQMDTSASATQTLEWRSLSSYSWPVPAGTQQVIPFKTDEGGYGITRQLDAGSQPTGRMVIVTPGVYHFAASVEWSNSAAGVAYVDTYMNLWRGGSKIKVANTVGSSGGGGANWDAVSLVMDADCLSGDIIEVAGSSGSAGILTIEPGRSWFVAHKLAGPGPIGPSGAKGDKGDVGYADLSVNLVQWGSTFVIGSNAPLFVDGRNVIVGDRILRVTPGGGHPSDGIFVVTVPGTGNNGTWVRATDADTILETYAADVKVMEGTMWGGTRWSSSLKSTDVMNSTTQRWWCFAGDTGWINITSWGNSWGQYAGWDTCAYRRLNGIVYLKGLCNGPGISTIFTLPPGFRPGNGPNGQHVVTASSGGYCVLNVFVDGRVNWNSGGASGWISLQIPPWPADN